FNSYFSGNTIELCPVGALTSDIYRFKARPWDLARVPFVCTGCSAGCNVYLDFRFGELLRVISRDNPELDGGWLCDRGRFNYRYVHGEERLRRPLVKKDGAFVEVSWEEAFAEIARRLRQVRRDRGGAAIGAIGGGRLTNEEAYLFQKLVRAVFGSPNVDWRVGEQYIASSREFPGRISDISQASGILLVDLLPAERIPVVDLRIRRAAGRGGGGPRGAAARRRAARAAAGGAGVGGVRGGGGASGAGGGGGGGGGGRGGGGGGAARGRRAAPGAPRARGARRRPRRRLRP